MVDCDSPNLAGRLRLSSIEQSSDLRQRTMLSHDSRHSTAPSTASHLPQPPPLPLLLRSLVVRSLRLCI